MSAERTVLLVDDDSMVRGWVRLALEGTEFRVAGETDGGDDVAPLVARRRPAVLLVDYRLADRTGTELVRELRRAGVAAPAVLMTSAAQRGFNEDAREAGAQGSVLKTGSIDELLTTLRLVVSGRDGFDVRHPPRETARGTLSPREREVLRLVAGGATNKEIAAELGVGSETVKTLLARTYAKLGAKRRAEAVSAAHERGIL